MKRTPPPRLAVLALLLVLPACDTLPGLVDPMARFEPRWNVHRLTGKASMQSGTAASPVNNPRNKARDLGQDHHDGDFGALLQVGDGFSGIDFRYDRIDMTDTQPGILGSDFGALTAGDAVTSRLEGDEFRIGYFGAILDETLSEGRWRLQLAPGVLLAHRDWKWSFREGTGARREALKIEDQGTPYAGLRARLARGPFQVQAEYLANPDLHWGGDVEGWCNDAEVALRYAFEDQDVSIAVGYRYSDFEAAGVERGLRYEADLALEGYFFAVTIGFSF
ncbi:MAG: hypothetical protein IT458_15570 [Planctomycetes bacterium]|nr:hypothetical protein [Planctomycetota bacterium]